MEPDQRTVLRLLVERALSSGSYELLLVWVDASILDSYRGAPGASVMRSNSVGRVKTGSWSLDFGIAPDDATLQVPVAQLAARLPETERRRWLDHLASPPLSRNFLLMQLHPMSCIDDGELRAW